MISQQEMPPLLATSGFNESHFQQYLMRVEEEEQKTARKGDIDKTVEEIVAPNIHFERYPQTPTIRIQLVAPQGAQHQRHLCNKSAGGFTTGHRRVQEVKQQISKSFDCKARVKGGKSRASFIG
jgi:hypothetical protein